MGKTEMTLNVVGYYMHNDPCPILSVQPTLDMAHSWSKDRLSNMLRDTTALSDLVKNPRSRDSGNTVLHKIFPSGHITIAGGNSPASLASRPIRLLILDEIDRFPPSAGTEGSPIDLAIRRTATFWNKKVLLVSTPTIKGISAIEVEYEQSDMRKFWVPCPECKELQVLKWKQVKFENEDPDTAVYSCEFCSAEWSDSQKKQAVHQGKWIAEKPFKNSAGFSISGLCSSWVSLSEAVAQFLAAKGHPFRLQTWVNTFLGESWEDQGDQLSWEIVKARAEDYSECPQGVQVVVVGVDVQDDRLELEFLGVGALDENWSLDYQILRGDPSSPALWEELRMQLKRKFKRDDGLTLKVAGTCIDSGGHYTQKVYDFTIGLARQRVFAIKGVGGIGKPWVSRSTGFAKKKGHFLLSVGVDTAKEQIFASLRKSQHGASFNHFRKSYDDEHFKQLCAEKCVVEMYRGHKKRVFKQIRPRNEVLDVRVYALAAFHTLNIRDMNNLMTRYKKNLAKAEEPDEDSLQEEHEPENTPPPLRRSRTRKRAKRGWVSGL